MIKVMKLKHVCVFVFFLVLRERSRALSRPPAGPLSACGGPRVSSRPLRSPAASWMGPKPQPPPEESAIPPFLFLELFSYFLFFKFSLLNFSFFSSRNTRSFCLRQAHLLSRPESPVSLTCMTALAR